MGEVGSLSNVATPLASESHAEYLMCTEMRHADSSKVLIRLLLNVIHPGSLRYIV